MQRSHFPALWGGRGDGPDLLVPDRKPTTTVRCYDIWLSGQHDVIQVDEAVKEAAQDGGNVSATFFPEAFRCNVVQPAVIVIQTKKEPMAAAKAPLMDPLEHSAIEEGRAASRRLPRLTSNEARCQFYDDVAEEKATEYSHQAIQSKLKLYEACRVNYPNGALGLTESPFGDTGEVYAPIAARQRRQQALDSRRLRADWDTGYPKGRMFASHVHPPAPADAARLRRADETQWRSSSNNAAVPQDHMRGGYQWRDEEGVRKHRLYYMYPTAI